MDYIDVKLDDGAVVTLSREAAEDLYDILWLLAPNTRGAVTTAAKLQHALRTALLHDPVTLDADETAVFVAARGRL
jgi:hypothetical protein